MSTANTVDNAPQSVAERVAAANHQSAVAAMCRAVRHGRLAEARFLATIAAHDIVERGRRRVERYLVETRLPAGTTFDNFHFEAVPMIPKPQMTASRRRWLDRQGRQSTPFRSARRRQAVIGLDLIEKGWSVLLNRSSRCCAEAPVARRELNLDAAINRLRSLRSRDP